MSQQKCRICGCTENDCRQCIEKTGKPCYWVEDDLCSACAPIQPFNKEWEKEMIKKDKKVLVKMLRNALQSNNSLHAKLYSLGCKIHSIKE